MNFNTKLNIGDTVWHISPREGCIRETTITSISLVHQRSGFYQGEYHTQVVYGSDDNSNFADYNEGNYWWSTRRDIIDYLTKTLKSVGNGKKSNPVAAPRGDSLSEAFEEFFGDHPKPPQEHFKIIPPLRPAARHLQKAFDDVFGKPKPPVKKTNCNCGLHRKSELVRRMKPLPGIREKTISDLYDELFES